MLLGSPTSPDPLDLPSAAAHTDPHPAAGSTDLAANAPPAEASGFSSTAAAAGLTPAPAAALANVKADAESTAAEPAGPKVGTAQALEELDAKQNETSAGEASTGIPSSAEAEKAIHAEAKKVDPEIGATPAAVERKEEAKDKAVETKEAAKDKAEEVKAKVAGPSTTAPTANTTAPGTTAPSTAGPITPKQSADVDASPARTGSTKSDKKKLSTRIKEKLHIGSSGKKSSP
jgi:hypothetical protein